MIKMIRAIIKKKRYLNKTVLYENFEMTLNIAQLFHYDFVHKNEIFFFHNIFHYFISN